MAEPGDAVRVDDVENSSGDEDEEESSTESDESLSSEESSSSEEDESEEEASDDEDDINVWDSVDDGAQTEEAIEASLQADYTMALNLIVDGRKQEALTLMEKLLQHPILQKFEVNVNLFDWNEARNEARANQSRVSAMARLFSSLHFNIGRLLDDPIQHVLSALTVYPNDEYLWKYVGEASLKVRDWSMALFAFGNCSSDWSVIRGTLIALYNANLFEDCLLKIKSVLEHDKKYFLGRVLKDTIRETNSYWEMKCRQIFNEDPVYVQDEEDDVEITEKDLILNEIKSIGKPTVHCEPLFKPVIVDVGTCSSLADVGIYFCDVYDRIEAFSSFSRQTVLVCGAKVLEELEKVSLDVLNVLVDCVDVVRDLIDKVVVMEAARSAAVILLNDSCAQESSVIPLLSVKPSSMACSTVKRTLSHSVDDGTLLRKCITSLSSKFMDNGRIFDVLEHLLFWFAKNCFCSVFTKQLREVVIGCYARWITTFGNIAMIRGGEFLPIHTMVAEIGNQEAMFVCYSSLSSSLEPELCARIHWLIAINGATTFSPQICKNHLWTLLVMLKSGSNPGVKYHSLITGHELISLETVQNLTDQMERRESLEAIQRLFDDRQFDKVVNIIIGNFSWKDVDRSALLSTALTLIDSYLELNDMDGAALWVSRLLDFTRGLAGTDEVVLRLKRVVMENVCLENVSNLVHCIVPLLAFGGYESDAALWLVLYRCASRLEGEHTVETLSALYENGCQMLTSALNILVTAHEAIAKHDRCFTDNHSFPLFVLNEFSKIRAHPAVAEVLSSGEYTEQNRAFIDEVHQCLFCLYGCPSRRKRQLEEHGGSHNHEPSLKDVENVLSLLLPEKIPPYDGSCSVDLIEFVQKKASSFLEPTEEEKEKLSALNQFIAQCEVHAGWPRCTKSSSLRSGVFYQLALHSYRNHKVDDAVHYAKMFLILASTELPNEIFFWDWTVLAFAATTAFFTVDEDEMFQHFDCSVFSFRMALFLDPTDRYVIFNFGSALYQINSRMRRFRDKICMDDIRYRWANRRITGLLEESRRQFQICIPRLPDGDVDRWRCHYFLAKIAEKRGDSLEDVFYHYHESARQLEAAGVQYPSRISLKKQDHAEAIEIHYRAYACLMKYLLESETNWNLEDLILMHSFAVCFRSHGVCKQKDSDEFALHPQVRATVSTLLYKCLEPNGAVQQVVQDLVERTALKLEILQLCEEAFKICILRFPHFKAYYRLSQLSLYKGDVQEASQYLFGRFLARKKVNYNPDNIFESVVTISCKDIDRGDALQYHLARIASLAIHVSALLDDFEALTTLIHTFCTLDFCHNTDYLLKRDLMVVYRSAFIKLLDCIKRKMKCNAVDSQLLCSIYDLHQYAERNGVQRLCERLQSVIVSAVKKFVDYDGKMEPMLFCKHLFTASKRRLGKRKISTSNVLQAKLFRSSSSPNSFTAV